MAPVGNKPKHSGKAVVAGGISGAVEICCTYPIEFTKTVQQLSTTKKSAFEVVGETVKARGPFGLYKGLDSMVYFATPKACAPVHGHAHACVCVMCMGCACAASIVAHRPPYASPGSRRRRTRCKRPTARRCLVA